MALQDIIAAAELTAPGPYTARSANDNADDWPYWYVTNDGRRNVLRFPGGAVFTSRELAQEIAERANARTPKGDSFPQHPVTSRTIPY